MNAVAKYATPRDLTKRTDGPRIAKIGKAIGKEFIPWQNQVVDVATEHHADGSYVYEIVIITVPRQSGKTTVVGGVQLDRVIMNKNIRCFYTAQTQKDARKRFEDLASLVKNSALDALASYRWSAGDEGISFPSGSALKLFAPGMAVLHGETPPLVTLDEFWSYDEVLGDAMLEGAIMPAQQNLHGNKQIWLISTAGTAQSTFMRKWIERGRESVLSGGAKWPKIAYFEWSLHDGDDPRDPDAIARFHPAVGHLVTAEQLLEIEVPKAVWLRAFCNVWTEATNPLFAAEDYAKLVRDPAGVPAKHDLTVTYEVAPDNECGVIMASWRDDEGAPCNRVLHAAPGTTWMHDLIVEIHDTWKPAVLGADDGGPTRRLTDMLRRTLGDEAVTTTSSRDFGTACEAWLTMARDRELVLDDSITLRNGAAHLVLKRAGDYTRFSRNDSTGPIVGPIAGAVGIWLHDHKEAPLEKPFISI